MIQTPGPVVQREDRNGCAVLTLHRPEVLNAINDKMLDAIDAHLDAIENDSSRALVFIGSGRAFCSGSDLGDRHAGPEQRIRRMHRLVERLRAYPKLSVAAINGLALGGGLEIPLACTFRVASPAARMGLPEIKLGLMPVYGATALLPRLIGESRSLEMVLSGELIDAECARAWGLISRVSANAETLLDEACALAASCGRHSVVPQRALRRLLREHSTHAGLAEALAAELEAGLQVNGSQDAREGIAAFVQKRKPVFRDC